MSRMEFNLLVRPSTTVPVQEAPWEKDLPKLIKRNNSWAMSHAGDSTVYFINIDAEMNVDTIQASLDPLIDTKAPHQGTHRHTAHITSSPECHSDCTFKQVVWLTDAACCGALQDAGIIGHNREQEQRKEKSGRHVRQETRAPVSDMGWHKLKFNRVNHTEWKENSMVMGPWQWSCCVRGTQIQS